MAKGTHRERKVLIILGRKEIRDYPSGRSELTSLFRGEYHETHDMFGFDDPSPRDDDDLQIEDQRQE